MASSRAVHEVSPDGAGSPAVGPSSNTPIHGFSPEGDSVLADLQNPTEQEATRSVESTQPVTAQAHSCPVRPTAGASEEEDASSSVSEVTAVGIGHKGDPGTRMQTRAREIEDEISRFCADSVNRITVSARNYIMSRVFELMNLCSDMRADVAMERGAALALQGQLVDARREIAGLQRQVLVAERPPVGDILGGLAAAPAVGPAHAVLAAGPGVQVATGATPTGPVVPGAPSYAAVVRAGGRAGRHPWCWAGWSCRTRWSSSRQGVWRQTRTRGVPNTGWSDRGTGTGRGPTVKDEHRPCGKGHSGRHAKTHQVWRHGFHK
ncbi:hypothetical protein HPB51_026527 [Rhipicephalus microplus]|uniref:Uncharacterized protein n=1 Tax=Rhipicephalus microplus TaxID=6941 RepID=A0A9J6D2U3_RHIMP|nr:hypothetical protein HPB51_026527 [Rhipicephalus microplus]